MFFLLLSAIVFQSIICDPLTKQENANRLRTCGNFQTSKVYQGREATQSEAPWSVLISRAGTVCTGTVVSSRHILTAVHCFADQSDNGWYRIPGTVYDKNNCKHGHYRIDDAKYLSAIQIISDKKIVAKSPERVTLVNACLPKVLQRNQAARYCYEDFAIIDLYEELEFSPSLRHVCIANDQSSHDTGSQLQYFGFGQNPPIDPGTLHHETIQAFKLALNFKFEDYYFLAKDPTFKTVACTGDSGGGAVKQINGRTAIVGVLSQTNCENSAIRGTPNITELYVSVPYYTQNICALTGICEPGMYDGYWSNYTRQPRPERIQQPDFNFNNPIQQSPGRTSEETSGVQNQKNVMVLTIIAMTLNLCFGQL